MDSQETVEKKNDMIESKIDFNGELSNEYDDLSEKIIPGYHSLYELAHHLLRDKLDKAARILVAGAGTGKEIIDCLQNNPHWYIIGFDRQNRCFQSPGKKWRQLLWKIEFPLSMV